MKIRKIHFDVMLLIAMICMCVGWGLAERDCKLAQENLKKCANALETTPRKSVNERKCDALWKGVVNSDSEKVEVCKCLEDLLKDQKEIVYKKGSKKVKKVSHHDCVRRTDGKTVCSDRHKVYKGHKRVALPNDIPNDMRKMINRSSEVVFVNDPGRPASETPRAEKPNTPR